MTLSTSQIFRSVRAYSKMLFVAFLFFSAIGNVSAESPAPSRPEILDALQKATLLMRVSGWVDWPNGNGQPLPKQELNICLLGKFADVKQFTNINGVIVDKRKLLVRPIANIEESKNNCEIVYISSSEAPQSKQIVSAFADKPILTVADIEDYAKAGGSMNFTHINGKLGVTINLESMGKVNLLLSPNAYRRITIVPEESELKG